jgi:hypothetical protein
MMTRTRKLAWIFLIIGGIIHLLSAVGHVILPSVLKWDAVVSEVPSVIKGMEVSNKTILYLFNAEFIVIAIGTAFLSFIFAPKIREGDKTAVMFYIYWGAFLFYRVVIGPLLLWIHKTEYRSIFQYRHCGNLLHFSFIYT